jgi:ferric-dicitrate binding protein FerR (iron transport regulator)
MNCADFSEDLVARALGQLSGEEAARLDAHLAACGPCRAEISNHERLFGAARTVPGPELAAGAEERLLAAFRAEWASGPVVDVPPPVRRRGALRVVSTWLPLAAAAGVIVVIASTMGDPQAEVVEGEGILRIAKPSKGADVVLRGRFDFEHGDEIAAAKPFTVRAPAPGELEAGLVEIKLLPMAHLRRVGDDEVELGGGAIEVAAGPLAAPFTVRAGNGPGRAVVRGTRFLATTADDRLVIVVREGEVELGREGGPSETLEAGEQGLVDAERLLRRPADARGNGDSLLTPRLALTPGAEALALTAVLSVGEGGPVSIQPFDDAEPRFVVEVEDGDGAREIKIQRSMLVASEPAPPPSVGTSEAVRRLAPDAPYRLSFSLAGIGLRPGPAKVSVRYMSYRHRGGGAEWLGVVESDPRTIEVPGK